MIFEWNPEKAKINSVKHKISFEEAATVFKNLLSDTFDDPDHSNEELRFITIGHSEKADYFSFLTLMTGKLLEL
jgi:uncharacterized DUF497 family protein